MDVGWSDIETVKKSHPRTLGWVGTTSLAMGGSNQSLFLLSALFVGQGDILGQGSATIPLLIFGLLLSYMAAPGWTELVLMFPNRVGGIAATCSEAFHPYSPVLSNLTGVCYWWGWVPTCGLTALLSASAIHQWYLPNLSINLLAVSIVLFFTAVNLTGVKWVARLVIPIAFISATLAFLSGLLPILIGQVDWYQATTFHLNTPFDGWFGKLTSLMAGLYLIGFAAPAFEAAACHVGETKDPNKQVPRAMLAAGLMAAVYFVFLPLVWLGFLGSEPLGKELALVLGPTFAPLFGSAAKAVAIWFMIFNMFHGSIQPLAGASRTLSQLAEDGLLPKSLAFRNQYDSPWIATILTASLSILFLLIGDPIWLIAAANFTYLIGICLPSLAVWLLRRDQPKLERPYRAPIGFIRLGLVATIIWGLSAILGFQQFGLPTVMFGLVFAYSGAALYALRKFNDRREQGLSGYVGSLHIKLTGAMVAVLLLDGAGYLVAVNAMPHLSYNEGLITALQDIFVTVAMLTISVGMILPGMIAHSAVEVSTAAKRLATGTMLDFSRAMQALGKGDLKKMQARIEYTPVLINSNDELAEMAASFNILQNEIADAARGVESAREALIESRSIVENTNFALLKSESTLRAIIDNAPIGIWMVGVDGRYKYVNKTYCESVGINEAQFLTTTNLSDLLGSKASDNCHKSNRESMEQKIPHISYETLPFVDGKEHFLEVTKVKVFDSLGHVDGTLGISIDITERNQAETKLKLAASVFNHALEGIMIFNAEGIIIEVNETFTKITGYSRKEALGKIFHILKSKRQELKLYDAMWKALLQDGHWYGDLWNQHKDGFDYVKSITISQVLDSNGATRIFVALFSDITLIKTHQQQLEHVAHYDVLTNLPNRSLLNDRLAQAMPLSKRLNKSVAVIYIDLDGFKAVNDQHGHDIGDDLLVALTHRMKTATRKGDTISRIGGDEFVILLINLEETIDCLPVLNRLLQATSSQVTIGDIKLQVSASIGVTSYPYDSSDADQLIRHADQAMYKAKQAGKNQYHFFDVEQNEAVQLQHEALKNITTAFSRQEFLLYFQPKVNMKTGEIVGFEALIRWSHPQRGILPPVMFLPLIENHSLNIEISKWVINTALIQISKLKTLGIDVCISVNIPANHLQSKHFVTDLTELLQNHPEVKPDKLELEILETSALEDITQISEVMYTCSQMGVRFAIDDFGTGYSSLAYLKRLPANILKIDQGFVRDMIDDQNDHAIVIGIVGLAKAFNKEVIAEGVETIAHGTLLLSLGCPLAQGYGIARPMPAEDIPNWIANWRPNINWVN